MLTTSLINIAVLLLSVASGTAINILIKRWTSEALAVKLSGQRLIVGGAILLAVSVALHVVHKDTLQIGSIAKLALIGLLVYTLPNPLVFLGLSKKDVSATDAAVIDNAIPGSAVLVLSVLRLDDGPSRVRASALVVASLLGLVLFLRDPARDPATKGARFTRGHLLLILGALSTTAGLILVAILFKGDGQSKPAEQVWVAMLRTGCAALPAGIVNVVWARLSRSHDAKPAAVRWTRILVLAIVGTVIGWTALFYLMTQSPLAAGIGIALIPIATAGYNGLRGDRIRRHQVVGATVVVLASLLLVILHHKDAPDSRVSTSSRNTVHATP